MKTLEEYILKQLEDTQEELFLVKKENEELKEKLNNRNIEELEDEELPNAKIITISEQPNYFYCIDKTSYSSINELLEKNNKTPEFLRQVLVDEEAYNEYCGLKCDSGYIDHQGGEVVRNTYDCLYVNYYGKKSIIFISYDKTNEIRNLDNKNYFLDYEKAKEKLKVEIFSNIEYYFKYEYDKKFKPKEEEKQDDK